MSKTVCRGRYLEPAMYSLDRTHHKQRTRTVLAHASPPKLVVTMPPVHTHADLRV